MKDEKVIEAMRAMVTDTASGMREGEDCWWCHGRNGHTPDCVTGIFAAYLAELDAQGPTVRGSARASINDDGDWLIAGSSWNWTNAPPIATHTVHFELPVPTKPVSQDIEGTVTQGGHLAEQDTAERT